MIQMDVRDIRLVDLRVPIDGTLLKKDTIPKMMDSLCEVGFLQPIRVRPIKVCAGPIREVDGWEITSGRHRFEAANRLRNGGDMRFDTVPCVVIENEAERKRRIAQIDENLCRTEMSPAERAKLTAERKELYEEEHPETKHGGAPGKSGGGKKAKEPNSGSLGFVASSGKATGKGKTAITVDARRGEVLGDDLNNIVGTSLDKGVELDALVKMAPSARREIIGRAKAGENVSAHGEVEERAKQKEIVRHAKHDLDGCDAPSDDEGLEAGWEYNFSKMAEYSIKLPSHWEKHFSGWRKLNITREQVLLAKKAASTWESIAKTLEGMCNAVISGAHLKKVRDVKRQVAVDDVHFQLSPCTVNAIDEWRRREPDMLTPTGALERLVEMGLEAAAKRKPKPEPKK
jgi:hypothetical protein